MKYYLAQKGMHYQAKKRHKGSFNAHIKWKKPVWKDYILYEGSNFKTLWKDKTMETAKGLRLEVAVGNAMGKGRWTGRVQKNLRQWNNSILWWLYVITYHQKANPTVYNELWVITRYGVGSSIVTRVPLWFRVLPVKAKHIWELTVLSAHFALP